MIQFNLLPDVKMQYVKAKRTKKLIISGSFLLSIGSVAIVAILFSIVQFAQKQHINDLSGDILAETNKIKSIENLNELLTVQNQLTLLSSLHKNKPESSRLFDYVTFVTPEMAKVQSLNFDSINSKLVLQGTADKIATVNKMVDNIKATMYVVDGSADSTELPAYSQVSTQLSGDNEKASFKIDLVFDPMIFNNVQEITMKLNGQTRSTNTSAEVQQ